MPSKAPARPEQSNEPLVNLASLPREDALERARVAGREILGHENALQAVSDALWMNWINVNMPVAVGQTDDEFGELVDAMGDQFFDGLAESVKRFAADTRTLDRISEFLIKESGLAWKIHNMLAFMEAALDDDTQGSLPIRCAVADLRVDQDRLATALMDLVWRASHA
ncbi:hypothetical protein [Paraburkholderia sp. BL25I1N1]|uniref:hypothetical protein n=1 Tax=Paraburkholderia sp. BL25I1N1 TaxID=1938804 RepID=UPI000D04D55D|nr:hypothetical protein [Paraburkholderia sp. BL25I1N1]PRY07044.1 hypothetical protein B0G73_105186 [Paraburkholderia sp. BL25I1N1]